MHRNKNLQPTYCLQLTQEVVSCDADNTALQEYSYSQVHTTHFAVEGNSIFNVLQAGRNKVLSDNPGPVRLKYGSNISCPISKPRLLYM